MPGANTYGSLSRSSRRRLAGWVQRDAGTVKPGGSSGVSASDLIVMIELTELGAAALRLLRLARALSFRSATCRRGRGVDAVETVHGGHERACCGPECLLNK